MFEGDKYHLWVPLEKSIEVDENGDYIVQGVMTSDDKDEESDVIDPGGMDCTYFLEKGWIKYEHGNNPDQFIGEPIEVRVGQFTHPKLNKSVHGIFVKGRLFAQRELARKAVQTIRDLQKSNTKRTMGWSIEGNVVERDRKTGKIVKSVLRNVVLTMNPVNTMTWVELAKSFAKNHELRIACEEVDKSLDTDGMAEITPQSLEGAKPVKDEEDKQQQFINLLRKMVRDFQLNKSFAYTTLNQSTEHFEADVIAYARKAGLSLKDAAEFAKYMADRHEVLKSMLTQFGGEKMSLLDILDEELEELRKSMADDADEDDEDQEYEGDGDEEEDDSEDSEGEEDDEDQEEDSEDEEDDEDSEETEKSLKPSELRKSLSYAHRQAFEVSDFLTDMTDEIGYQLQGLEKSITQSIKTQQTLMEIMRELVTQVEELKAENADLKKSLDEVLSQPLGRKSVVSGREYQTLSKSMNQPPVAKSPAQVREILEKSFEAGELDGSQLIRFENGVPLHMLELPATVKKELGLI